MNNTLHGKQSQTPFKKWLLDLDKGQRWEIYNRMPSFLVNKDSVVDTESLIIRDNIFDALLETKTIKKYKLLEKKEFLGRLLQTARIAEYHDGCIRYSRRRNHITFSDLKIQVIDACIANGLFQSCRSPSGSPKMSRLISTRDLSDRFEEDPNTFDPSPLKCFVVMRDRKTKEEIEFDKEDTTYKAFQKRLDRLNQVNNEYVIYYSKWDKWQDKSLGKKRLRPIHYAIFTDSFNLHGRIYTGKYGHQSLTKQERSTITFDGEKCIELDYSGYHPRMVYHLAGMDYRDDPYSLWPNTTPHKRLMAKVFLNALINAKSEESAIDACNAKMRLSTNNGRKKSGRALERARTLSDAHQRAGIEFAEILPLVKRTHKRIANKFTSDLGVELMNHDAKLGLEVLYEFSRRGEPCLSCHDSFVVPVSLALKLKSTMLVSYEDRFGFLPKVD